MLLMLYIAAGAVRRGSLGTLPKPDYNPDDNYYQNAPRKFIAICW